MINKKILFETEYNDFLVSNKPKTNNVAEWMMQMYELEFKLNLIKYSPEYFDDQDNITGITLEEVQQTLEENVRVIGRYLISTIYLMLQNWKNYHNIADFIPNIMHSGTIKEDRHPPYFISPNIVDDSAILQQILTSYTVINDPKVQQSRDLEILGELLSVIFETPRKKPYFISQILSNSINAFDSVVHSSIVDTFYHYIYITVRQYFEMFSEDPRLNKEIKEDMEDILDAIDYHTEILDEHFIEIGIVYQILKRLDETSQGIFKKEVVRLIHSVLETSQKSFIAFLMKEFNNRTKSLLTVIDKILQNLYSTLVNINNVSQHTIIMNSNIAINTVHHRSSFAPFFKNMKRGIWLQSGISKYYPHNVTTIIPKEVIDWPIIQGELYFDGEKQYSSSMNRIFNAFTNRKDAEDYVDNYINVKGVDETGRRRYRYLDNPDDFLDLLSSMPKPDLRYWQQELTKFGLDKHIHLLLDIDGTPKDEDKYISR